MDKKITEAGMRSFLIRRGLIAFREYSAPTRNILLGVSIKT